MGLRTREGPPHDPGVPPPSIGVPSRQGSFHWSTEKTQNRWTPAGVGGVGFSPDSPWSFVPVTLRLRSPYPLRVVDGDGGCPRGGTAPGRVLVPPDTAVVATVEPKVFKVFKEPTEGESLPCPG